MALKMSTFVKLQDISVVVNFPVKLNNMSNSLASGYVLDKKNTSSLLVRDYLSSIDLVKDNNKILQVLGIVKLDLDILDTPLNVLTRVESQKVELAYLLLLQSKVIIVEHFFKRLIYGEKQYFMRLFRNLVSKRGKSIILLENDMDFVAEFFKKFFLFTEGENYREITNFYDDSIYNYVSMPKTVELVKYLEGMGHQVDHELTFNETLKAIYRGVA